MDYHVDHVSEKRLKKSPVPESARVARLAGAVLIGALLVRIFAWLAWKDDILARQPMLDAFTYYRLATGALAVPEGPYLHNPITAWFLEAVFTVLGAAPSRAILVHMALGAVGAELAFLSGYALFRKTGPALAAGGLAALYGPFMMYEGLLLGAPLAVFLVWAFLAAISLFSRIDNLWLLPGAGLALGLAGIARPPLLAAAPALAVWCLFRDRNLPVTRRLLDGALLTIGCLLALTPTFLHNAAHGEWWPLPRHGGINFYIGNHRGASGTYEGIFKGPHAMTGQRRSALREASRLSGRRLTWAEADRFWFRRGVDEASEDLGAWAALTGRKALWWLNRYEVPLDYNPAFLRTRSTFLRMPLPGFGFVAILAGMGAVFLLFDRRFPWPLAIFLAAAGAASVLFFCAARYRLPLIPPLILLAAYGMVEGARATAAMQLIRLGAGLALAAVFGAVAFLPTPASDFAGSWRMVGDAFKREARLFEAIGAYEKSIDIRETSAAWNNLGTTLLDLHDKSRLDEAITAFRQARDLDQGNRQAWNNLGVATKRSGDLFEAEAIFEETRRRFPRYRLPAENLAQMYEEAGDVEGAREFRRRAGLIEDDEE